MAKTKKPRRLAAVWLLKVQRRVYADARVYAFKEKPTITVTRTLTEVNGTITKTNVEKSWPTDKAAYSFCDEFERKIGIRLPLDRPVRYGPLPETGVRRKKEAGA